MSPGLIELSAAVRSGATTPGELLVRARERSAALDGRLRSTRAWISGAELERELSKIPAGTQFYGVPVGVKDMFTLDWYSPTDGTGIAATSDDAALSDVAQLLRHSGLVAAAVTTMHQLGVGSTGQVCADGPQLNPWGDGHCAGGSSGGSAASVAAGILPAAVGTDAAGSIRIPAAYCGVTGLKPTFAAVPVGGYNAAYSSMGVVGPIARDAADCAALAGALMGPREGAPLPDRFTIGVPTGPLWNDVQPDVRQRCQEALDALAGQGATIREIDFPFDLDLLLLASLVITGAERQPQLSQAWVESVFPRLDVGIRGIIRSRLTWPTALLSRAIRFRSLLRSYLADTFENVDLLAWPTLPCTAPRVDALVVTLPSGRYSPDVAAVRPSALANLTGVPAITAPCGLDRNGLPVGLSFHARWGSEGWLLAAAAELEQATDRRFVTMFPPNQGTPSHDE